MGSENFILSYVHACAGGKLAFAECGPVWQLGIIATLLTAAIMFLVLPRILPQRQSAQS
jgi:hypothetical protein